MEILLLPCSVGRGRRPQAFLEELGEVRHVALSQESRPFLTVRTQDEIERKRGRREPILLQPGVLEILLLVDGVPAVGVQLGEDEVFQELLDFRSSNHVALVVDAVRSRDAGELDEDRLARGLGFRQGLRKIVEGLLGLHDSAVAAARDGLGIDRENDIPDAERPP